MKAAIPSFHFHLVANPESPEPLSKPFFGAVFSAFDYWQVFVW